VKILTFCANYISHSYSTIHTEYLDQPPKKKNILPRTVLGQCETLWNLKAVEHIYWCVVSSSSKLTADICSAVMLKANKPGTVLDLCKCIQM
jgi:hypothetical protein